MAAIYSASFLGSVCIFNEMFITLFGNMIRMSITVQSGGWLQCFTSSREMGLGSHNEG